jgi:hypothetical protein
MTEPELSKPARGLHELIALPALISELLAAGS